MVSSLAGLNELARQQSEDMQSLRQVVLWSTNDLQLNIQEVKSMVEVTEGTLKAQLRHEFEGMRHELGLQRRNVGQAAVAAELEATQHIRASAQGDPDVKEALLTRRIDEAVGIGIAELRGELIKHLQAVMGLLRNTMGVFDVSLGAMGGLGLTDGRSRETSSIATADTGITLGSQSKANSSTEDLRTNSLPLLQGFREQLDNLVLRIDGIFRARLTAQPSNGNVRGYTSSEEASPIFQCERKDYEFAADDQAVAQWVYNVPQVRQQPVETSPVLKQVTGMPKRGSSPTRVVMPAHWPSSTLEVSSPLMRPASSISPGKVSTPPPLRVTQHSGSMLMPAGGTATSNARPGRPTSSSRRKADNVQPTVLTASVKQVSPAQLTYVGQSIPPPGGTSGFSARVPMMR